MKDMGQHLVEMLRWLASKKTHPLRIVECGTIRNPSLVAHKDGLATYHIAKWIKESGVAHEFYSFELDPGTIARCKSFLAEQCGLDQYVTFGLGDACLLMQHFGLNLDFAYLDAGADPDQNLKQFEYARGWMREEPGFIVIDDCFDPSNANRGVVTVPHARLEGLPVGVVAGRMAAIALGVEAGKFLSAVCD